MVQTSDLYQKPGSHNPPPTQARQRLAKLLPIALLLAFILLLVLLFGGRFVPARVVQLESVVTQRSQPQVNSTSNAASSAAHDFDGKALFQASGWIEADPLPIRVSALNDGFVETVHILEGQRVSSGQLLVKLVDDDAQLDVASAQAAHDQQVATLTEKQALVRSIHARLLRLEQEVEIEQARLKELRDDEARLNTAGLQSVSEQEITLSRLRVLTQQAVIQALEANRGELNADLDARNAAVQRTRHELQAAKTDLARKQLALDRMQILSPIDGIIQQLFVSPGKKRFAMMDDPESATIAVIYKPDALQARIDVPLEEAAQLSIGQAVRLRSVFQQDKVFEGRVSRIEGQADLQRNTLQAKVELLSSADNLRPEMLCRAEFLSPTTGKSGGSVSNQGRAAIYVPTEALIEDYGEYRVWVLDASGKRAQRLTIQISNEELDGYRQVLKGLKPGDRVVVNPPADLQEGDRIRPSA